MTSNKDFKNEDICSIIRACKEGGVSELTFGKLHIKFKYTETELALTPTIELQPEQIQQQTKLSESQAREARVRDELRLREDQLEQMAIEDPVQFEKLLANGDLEDERV